MAAVNPNTPPAPPAVPPAPSAVPPAPPWVPPASTTVSTIGTSAVIQSVSPNPVTSIAPTVLDAAGIQSSSSAVAASNSAASAATLSLNPAAANSGASITPSSQNTSSITSTLKTSDTQSPTNPKSSTISPSTTGHHHEYSESRLSNSAVAGIVIGVGIGLALISSLLTYVILRHRKNSSKPESGDLRALRPGDEMQQSSQSSRLDPKAPLVTQVFNNTSSFEGYLPQSADDRTLQNKVKTTLDQLELHVENFYQNGPGSGSRNMDGAIAMFDSPSLPNQLATLLTQTANATPLIKHALAYYMVSSISLDGSTDSTLLPAEFVLLPSTVDAANIHGSAKPSFNQCMSQWRLLTVYLRPSPSQDSKYISQRDRRINGSVQACSQAFALWRNPKYGNDDQIQSLQAIFKSAAELGIWIFSQPSDLQFRWPEQSEMGPNRVAVAPELVKKTDEKGRALAKPQVMLEAVIKKFR